MQPQPPPSLGFADLVVGGQWLTPGRTVGQAEVGMFAALSGDFNPLHVDHQWAARGPYGRPVAHGLLGLAIASGLASQCPRVATLAFLGIVDWTFVRPIFLDDTLRVLSRVDGLEPRGRGKRGLVTWHRQLLNQEDQVVQEGLLKSLVGEGTGATA